MRFISMVMAMAIVTVLVVPMCWADGMRCGNDIVNIRDSAFMVEQKCGEPISKTEVGYTINEEQKRELFIEEWVYGPHNDYYYFVTMVGGRVSQIRSERR
ncbi:MAG: DUF2845 domain-containing protein [Desulfosarcinaceae bacterium]